MGQVTVEVNAQRYKLACRDGEEERLITLARFVDDRINELAGSLGNVGDARLLLMASLVIADELLEAREAAGGTPSSPDAGLDGHATARLDRLVQEIEDIAARLQNA
ncbi:MAG: cell division protein ZapA [Alphaproteobacteria bacterium]|nr:MAG: cell division protein ZapA [Alphaproteobacteria bacterium]